LTLRTEPAFSPLSLLEALAIRPANRSGRQPERLRQSALQALEASKRH